MITAEQLAEELQKVFSGKAESSLNQARDAALRSVTSTSKDAAAQLANAAHDLSEQSKLWEIARWTVGNTLANLKSMDIEK